MRRVHLALATGFILAAISLGRAQQAPTFRSRTDLVVVDFQAMTSDGTPIPDLKKEELTLRVGGKIREIKTLDFVKLADVDLPAAAAPKESPKPLLPPPSFGSNLQTDVGRSVFLVIDDESMLQGQERQARDAAERFIDALPPRDQVALMTVPYQAVTIDLTTSRERVKEALHRITGHLSVPTAHLGSSTAPATPDCGAASLVTFDVLRKLFQSLSSLNGPKTVVLISGGVNIEREATHTMCQYPTVVELAELGHLAARARIQLSFIQPSLDSSSSQMGSTTASESLASAQSTLTEGAEDLVGVTGGELFKASAKADAVFQKISRASSAYYLLAFDPDPDEQDGKTHKVSLSVSRPGVDLRARPEFEIENPAKPVKSSAPAKATTPEAVLLDRRTYDDLPVLATAYVVRASDRSKLKVVAIADTPGSATPFDAAVFGLIDAKDKMVARWSVDAKELARHPIASATLVAPGAYRLRVGARDAAGRLGAADFEFNAKLTKAGDFDLSDLLVGVQRSDEFMPKFVYTTEPTAFGYMELYAVDAGVRQPSMTFEVAATSAGPALGAAKGRIAPSKEAGRFIATGTLPIASLAPGDYVVRAIVRQGDKIVGTVIRSFRKGA